MSYTHGIRNGVPVVIDRTTNATVHTYRKSERKLAEKMAAKLNG